MTRSFLAWFTFSALMASAWLAPNLAAAQTKAQRDATTAFRDCREMEKYGDATPCWRRWLERHKAAGSEAEVLVAEERVAKGKPEEPTKPTPAPTPVPEEPEAPEEPATESPSEVPPAEEPGEPAAGGVPVPIVVAGPDLCGQGDSKQKAVVFGIAGADALGQDAQFQKAEAARHLTLVFLERFPNPRFSNLTTTLPGDPTWASVARLAVKDVQDHVSKQAGDSPEATQLSAALGCANFIVFATLVKFSSKPGDGPAGVAIELTGKMGIFKRQGDQLEQVGAFDAEVPSMFDKAEDMAAQSAAATLDGATSSIDSANETAAGASDLADQAADTADAVGDTASAVGDAAGAVAEGQVPEGVAVGADSKPCEPGSAGCETEEPPEPEPVVAKPSAEGAHERMGALCMKAAKSKDPTELLACEVRVHAYMLANSFKESSLDVPGWQLSAPLQVSDGRYGLTLGDAEDISVGDAFDVLDENGNRVAFFKVVSVGPGGAQGQVDLSELSLRLGDAQQAGATLSEHGMLGLGVQVYGGAAALLGAQAHAAPYIIRDDQGNASYQTFALPKLMFGGGAALSYDLSWLVSWPEFSVRAGGEFLMGNGTATEAQLISTELLFEKGFYLGTGLELYVGLGPALSIAKVRSVPRFNPVVILEPTAGGGFTEAARIPGQIVDMQAMRFGGTGIVGVEFLFTPNVALRFEAPFRIHMPKQGYDSANPAIAQCPTDPTDPTSVPSDAASFPEASSCWGFNLRSDRWMSAGGRLGAIVMF